MSVTLIFLLLSSVGFSQGKPQTQKVNVTGKVVEKNSKQQLEYATITFKAPGDTRAVAGGITDLDGNFNIAVTSGTYDITIEFISFQPTTLKNKKVTADLNLGTIALSEDAMMLNEVVVRAESTTVQIKLDKKVYSVGSDLLVKGGTVSDVLDNIPSVTVDAEGTVSLRGNENVRILIDGRPSNAINIQEALRLIPADAIDKVEVVTNPSARYDSEGGGGLLNIILKKGKNQGVNGTIIGTVGDPENYGISANINYKTDKLNVFTTTGYNYRNNPGNSIINTEYFDDNRVTRNFIDETRENNRLRKGYSTNFGMDWYLTDMTTWSNSVNLRRNLGDDDSEVTYNNFDANRNFISSNQRLTKENSKDMNVEYATNFTRKFKKDGHKFSIDGSFSRNSDKENGLIDDGLEKTTNDQLQYRNIIQADYVLPIGEDSQFEVGYKGDFNNLSTDFAVGIYDELMNDYISDSRYTNELQYKEKINALYTQYGTKFNKFSVLLGLRWEDSNIDINLLTDQTYNNKRYNDFFPSAFLTYELSEMSSVSLSYSKRVSRPRGRFINPFSNYTSNINLFQGNPDLDASLTDAFDLGYLKRWGKKLTLSTSMYLNRTTDSFQFIRRESGDYVTTPVDGGQDILTPVLLTTPINLGLEYRFGFEFTTNYTPFKWWRLNTSFNLYRNETQGDYTYTNSQDEVITQNFDNIATSWFARVTSKVTLPYAIEWQSNVSYNAPQNTAQGRSKGVASANLGFSKDFFKDKATVSLNIQDLFNSRKRITETFLDRQNSYSEFQWRQRQVNLSVTYRFNRKKNERENTPRREMDGGEEFPG